MKLVTRVMAVLALLALFAFAPLMQAQDATSHFSFDGSAVGFQGPGGASAATIVGGSINITKRGTIGYQQVLVPANDATYYFGTAGYSIPLARLVGKNINSHFVFDSSKWNASFLGGLGVIRQGLTGALNQHIAETLGACLNYSADSHITVQPICGQWLHANIAGPAGNQLFFTPNIAAVRAGLKIGF